METIRSSGSPSSRISITCLTVVKSPISSYQMRRSRLLRNLRIKPRQPVFQTQERTSTPISSNFAEKDCILYSHSLQSEQTSERDACNSPRSSTVRPSIGTMRGQRRLCTMLPTAHTGVKPTAWASARTWRRSPAPQCSCIGQSVKPLMPSTASFEGGTM